MSIQLYSDIIFNILKLSLVYFYQMYIQGYLFLFSLIVSACLGMFLYQNTYMLYNILLGFSLGQNKGDETTISTVPQGTASVFVSSLGLNILLNYVLWDFNNWK